MKEEHDILLAISNGNIKAFEYIYCRYQPQLKDFLTKLIHDPDIAHDMAQDIFLSIWEKRNKLSTVTSFSAYLFSAAKYSVFNYYDHRDVENKFIFEYITGHSNTYISEEEALFAKEMNRQISKIVDSLSPQRKKIFIMSRKEGKSNNEIAQLLNISKRTVENHLTYILAILRKELFVILLLKLWEL